MNIMHKTITDPVRSRVLNIMAVLRILVTVTFCWMLTIKLTPPNKPVENGLEVLVPGVVIIVLGLPTVLVGVALMRYGRKALGLAVTMDVIALFLVICAFILIQSFWITLAGLMFVIDIALLMAFDRT